MSKYMYGYTYVVFSVTFYVGVRVSFNQSSYTVYENDELLPVLTLSNPSSFDVTIRIRDAEVTAMS